MYLFLNLSQYVWTIGSVVQGSERYVVCYFPIFICGRPRLVFVQFVPTVCFFCFSSQDTNELKYTDVNKKRLSQLWYVILPRLTSLIILNICHIFCLPFTHSEMLKRNYSDSYLKHDMLLKTYTPHKIPILFMNQLIRHRFFRLLKASVATPTHKP